MADSCTAKSTDRYLDLVNAPVGKTVAARLGLPRPARLRRYHVGEPLLPGPLLLGPQPLGPQPDGPQRGTNAVDGPAPLAGTLAAIGAEVDTADREGQTWGALVFDATAARSPRDLAELREFLAGPLRRLAPSGRVLVIGRAPDGEDPQADAARQGLDGIVRSLAKELRRGATANLIQLAPDVAAVGESHPAAAALRFFLSGRSAYVDGQALRVDAATVGEVSDAGEPADWSRPLDGRLAVVTGAARGIGAAIARVLARDGARPVLVDLPAAGDALARVANSTAGIALQLDIAAPDAAARLAAHLRQRHGGVDIVVHNAGITRDRLLANMKPGDWDAVLAVNLESQLRLNAALLDDGLLRAGGRVVCLASTTGIAGNRGQTNYAASKAGVIGMVRSLAPRFAAAGATINAVAPGFIDTDMTRSMPLVTREVARRLGSLQQAGQPVDVAETVAFFCQPAAGGVNGQVLRVCGQSMVGA